MKYVDAIKAGLSGDIRKDVPFILSMHDANEAMVKSHIYMGRNHAASDVMTEKVLPLRMLQYATLWMHAFKRSDVKGLERYCKLYDATEKVLNDIRNQR